MKRSTLLLILTTLILLPTIAQAQSPITLEPTKYGATLNATGEALAEWLLSGGNDKANQVFTLAVHADIPNREALSISIETKSGVYEIGSLRMLLTTGTMEKWNSEPSPLFPIDGLISITVRYGKREILYGYF